MNFLVEQDHEAVDYLICRTAREAITGKLETETAKQFEKARLEKGSEKKYNSGGSSGTLGSE